MPKTSIPSGVWGRCELDPHCLQWADKTCAGPNSGEWLILFQKGNVLIGLEKWGSKEGTKGEKKVYRAHAAGLFPLFWEGKSWASRVSAAPGWGIGKHGVLILAREMPLPNRRVEFLVCPGTHTTLWETQIEPTRLSHTQETCTLPSPVANRTCWRRA